MVPVECPFGPGAVIFPTGITPRFNEFYDSLDILLVPEGSSRLRLGGPNCDEGRNRALRLIDPETRWVLFLDDDQAFDSDILIRMLSRMHSRPDIDALTGWYVKKTPPFSPVLFGELIDDPNFLYGQLTLDELIEAKKKNDLVQVSATGGGMLLVKRETLDKVGDPWFVPGPARNWGGDIGFCDLLEKRGLKLWCDLTLGVGHSMPCTITPVWRDGALRIKFSFGDSHFEVDSKKFPDTRAIRI